MSDDPRERAVQRIEAAFRDVYLTLVSIIQGVALGFLVQQVGDGYHDIDLDRAGRIVTIFAAIVIIWQEYAVGSTMYAWIPGTIDAVVPFLLGAAEGLMIAALDAPVAEFLAIFATTVAVGLAAAVNYARHAKAAELETTRQAQQVIAIHPRLLVWLDVTALVGTTCLAAYAFSPLPQPHPAVWSWTVAGLLMLRMASHHWRWTRPMRGRR